MLEWLENNKNKAIILQLQQERQQALTAAIAQPQDKPFYQERLAAINREIEKAYAAGR